MDRKKVIMGIIAAFFLATSTLGFIVSFGGTAARKTFQYEGQCSGRIKEIKDTYWLIYTLQEINVPGDRQGPYIKVVPTPEVKNLVSQRKLLYWRTATVETNLEGASYPISAFVLGDRNVGDLVLLDCQVVVQNGRVTYSNAIEIPEGA